MSNIYIFISDVAAFIGQNPYDFVTPFERLWKKIDQLGYSNALNILKNSASIKNLELLNVQNNYSKLENDLNDKKITKRQYTIAINKLDDQTNQLKSEIDQFEQKIDSIDLSQQDTLKKVIGKEIVDDIQNASIETSDKRIKVNELVDNLDISDDKKQNIRKQAESFINKSHGTIKEDSALEMFEHKFGVTLDKSQKFYKQQLHLNSSKTWYICGKMDGIYDHPTDPYIVEIKNRMRGFFNTLREYEKTQIQLYMYMTNCSKAKLVEKFQSNIRITEIYKDDEYIQFVIDRLHVFVKNFELFLNDEYKKQYYVNLNTESKREFLHHLYLSEIYNLDIDSDSDRCMIDEL
jgi:predicted  nucleic acid-binding Zn-ribbon protein